MQAPASPVPRQVNLFGAANLQWRTDEMKNIRATPTPSRLASVRYIGAAVLAASRRTQPNTTSLVTTGRGNMASTMAAHQQEPGVFAVTRRGASVA